MACTKTSKGKLYSVSERKEETKRRAATWLAPSGDFYAAIAGRGRSPLNQRRPQPRHTNCRMDRPLFRSTTVSSLSGAWHFQQRMPSGPECIDCIMANHVRPTNKRVDG